MDFLERILALSPDGGSGATELLLFSVIACALVAMLLRPRKVRVPAEGRPVAGIAHLNRFFFF